MKFLKKHFTKFLMSFTLAFTCLFVAFGCNTYAFTIDNNGNLIGDNLFNDYEPYSTSGNVSYTFNNTECRVSASSSATGSTFITYYFNNIEIGTTYYFKIWEYNYLPSGIWYSNTSGGSWNPNVSSVVINATQNDLTINIDIQKNVDNVFRYISLSTNNLQAWEPYGTWYSQENYNQLQSNYNNLNAQYINLKNRYNYGFFANLSSLRIIGYNSGVEVFDDSFTLQDLINTNYFSNGIFLLDNFILSYNSNTYDNASIKFVFSPNLIPSNVDLIFVGSYAFNFHFVVGFSDNSTYGFTITNESNVISHRDLNNYSVSFGNVSITDFKFSYNKNDYIPNINYNSDYSFAYNTGFSDGQNASFSTIQQLENNINDLNSQVVNLSNTISTLQVAYNDLNTSYENMLNGNNFANLFFTIAETPFASFKQIWNVDFLGVNLAGFVTGILFLGLIIWVIKKIF